MKDEEEEVRGKKRKGEGLFFSVCFLLFFFDFKKRLRRVKKNVAFLNIGGKITR